MRILSLVRQLASSSAASSLAALFVLACLSDASLAGAAARASPRLHQIGKSISVLGLSGYMLVIAAAFVLAGAAALHRGRVVVMGAPAQLLVERAAYCFATIALSGIFAQIIKHLVGRARPKLMPDLGAFHFDPLSLKASLASFPSGHTATAFAAAFALSCFAPGARPLFYGLAVMIALARILAGDHYPSDVVAGAIVGTLTAAWLAAAFAARHTAFDPRGRPLASARDFAPIAGPGSMRGRP